MATGFLHLKFAAAVLVTAVLSGCASQNAATVAADDEALCQYSVAAGTTSESYERCLSRLQGQRNKSVALNAGQISGYALLPKGAAETDVAGRCKEQGGTKVCAPSDVTGTIPKNTDEPRRPTAPQPR